MGDLRTMIDEAVSDVRTDAEAFERTARRARARQRRRRIEALVVAAAVATTGTAIVWRSFQQPSSLPAAPRSGVLVVTTQRPSDMSPVIGLMDPNTGAVTMLAPGLDPALSPDGSRIAFARTSDDGSTGIFVMNVDGTDVHRLTTNPDGNDENPSWSPGGQAIVFSRSTFVRTDPDPVASRSRRDLYTVTLDGGELKRLLDGTTDDFSPDWSPDGNRVAFARMIDPAARGPWGGQGIWTLDLSTGETTRVTVPGLVAWSPDWSPDGSRLAFHADGALYVGEASGGPPTAIELPASVAMPAFATWSPDGTHIAFAAGTDDNLDVFVAKADGSEVQRFERPGTNDVLGSWGPAASPSTPESPSASPTPSDSLSGEGRDVGLPFRVCHTATLGGLDLLGDGTSGRAWTGVPVKEDGTCPRYPAPMKYVLAVDHTGDAKADSSLDLPFACYQQCTPHDGTDFDGDGSEELIVANHFSIMDFYFFTIASSGASDPYVAPIVVARPGHEPAGIEAGALLRIDAWGDAGYGSSITCEGYPSSPVIVWSWSSSAIDGDRPTEVHVTRIRLEADGMFRVIGTNDDTVPAGQPSSIPYQGDVGPQCGVHWGSDGSA